MPRTKKTPEPTRLVSIGNPQTVHYLVARGTGRGGDKAREWSVYRKGDLARYQRTYLTEDDAVRAMHAIEDAHAERVSREQAEQSADAGWVL